MVRAALEAAFNFNNMAQRVTFYIDGFNFYYGLKRTKSIILHISFINVPAMNGDMATGQPFGVALLFISRITIAFQKINSTFATAYLHTLSFLFAATSNRGYLQ